jgi:hypothetical protein
MKKNCNKRPLDLHSEWLLNVATHLAKKVNPNIQVSKKGNILQIGNISESDLPKLSFVASKDTSNRVPKLVNLGISIPDSNGNPLSLNIPGLTAIASKIFADSDADAFLSGKKLFRPFASHSSDSTTTNNVSQYIDTMTSINPSLTKSSGKSKTFNLDISYDVAAGSSQFVRCISPFGNTESCSALLAIHISRYTTPNGYSQNVCTQSGSDITCPVFI